MFNIIYAAEFRDIEHQFCVYTIFDATVGKFKYVGMCQLRRLFELPDLRRINANFITPTDRLVIQVTHICDNKIDALKKHVQKIKDMGIPEINKYGFYKMREKGIKCIDTGETFRTIQATARAHGIDPGALSRHLRGGPGHKTVGGRRYEKFNQAL